MNDKNRLSETLARAYGNIVLNSENPHQSRCSLTGTICPAFQNGGIDSISQQGTQARLVTSVQSDEFPSCMACVNPNGMFPEA